MDETIFACLTPRGVGAIAVFRLSGPGVRDILARMVPGGVPPARMATFTPLRHPETAEVIDHVVVTFFPAPKSFTGDDTAEISTHGSPAVASALMSALGALPTCRMAEPGEFTRRAFLNGKMDLTQAEAIADLNLAETTLQRRQALAQMGGGLRDLYDSWRADVLHASAYLAAHLDFADEEDIPPDIIGHVAPILARLQSAIAAHTADNRVGERIRDGFSAVILGPPNAGKSTLLNALCAREAAIVSPHAGTTRDVIDVHLDIGGYPVVLSDTAGLRAEGGDGIEAEGMRRAGARAASADLKMLVLDMAEVAAGVIPEKLDPFVDAGTLVILNKADKTPDPEIQARALATCRARYPLTLPPLVISLQTPSGAEKVARALQDRLAAIADRGHEGAVLTRARHRTALADVSAALARAGAAETPELKAEDLRLAAAALGRLTGRIDVEDMLDTIFRDFCIGK